MLNSIGLQGPGIDGLARADAARARRAQGLRVWVSVGGFSAADFAGICERLDERGGRRGDRAQPLVPERRGGARDARPRSSPPAARARRSRSTRSSRPRPGTSPRSARAVVAAGADGLSLVNTIRGLALDPATLRPKLGRGTGGYSGPALRPIALACVCGVRAGGRRADRRDGRRALGARRARARRGGSERCRAWHHSVRRSRLRRSGSAQELRRRSRGARVRRSARRAGELPIGQPNKIPANRAKRFCLTVPAGLLDSSPMVASKTQAQAPARSLDQRMEALKRANDIRVRRAQLKKDLKDGTVQIEGILLDPPEYVSTAKVFDMLMAVPSSAASRRPGC